MTPFAHAFAYAIKKTPYAFFAKITLCMYVLCDSTKFLEILHSNKTPNKFSNHQLKIAFKHLNFVREPF